MLGMSATSGMLRSSAFWRSSSTRTTPPEKASRRSFATSSSRKSGTRSSASMKEAPASRDQLQRPDRVIAGLDPAIHPSSQERESSPDDPRDSGGKSGIVRVENQDPDVAALIRATTLRRCQPALRIAG